MQFIAREYIDPPFPLLVYYYFTILVFVISRGIRYIGLGIYCRTRHDLDSLQTIAAEEAAASMPYVATVVRSNTRLRNHMQSGCVPSTGRAPSREKDLDNITNQTCQGNALETFKKFAHALAKNKFEYIQEYPRSPCTPWPCTVFMIFMFKFE